MRLLSQAMDEPIGFLQRLAIRVHCFVCPGCARYRGQLPWLRSALRQAQERVNLERVATFSAEEKEKLNQVLRAASDE
jgi:hypothetical protein